MTIKEQFEYCDKSGTHTIISNHILCCADTGRVVAVFYNEHDLLAATGLTKKIKLINGQAYQFECGGSVILGFYISSRKSFFTSMSAGSKIAGLQECTNIELLELSK